MDFELWSGISKIFAVLCVFLLDGSLSSVRADGANTDSDHRTQISAVCTGAGIGAMIVLAVLALVFFVLKKKHIIDFKCKKTPKPEDENAGVPLSEGVNKTGASSAEETADV